MSALFVPRSAHQGVLPVMAVYGSRIPTNISNAIRHKDIVIVILTILAQSLLHNLSQNSTRIREIVPFDLLEVLVPHAHECD